MEDQFPSIRPSFAVSLVALTITASLMIGCDDGVETPEQTVLSFLTNLRQGDSEAAMEAIWPATRAVVESAYDDLEHYLGDQSPRSRDELLVVTRLESPMLIARIRAGSPVPDPPEEGHQIMVEIEFRDDRQAEVPVRWSSQSGRWFVDLPVEARQPLAIGDDARHSTETDAGDMGSEQDESAREGDPDREDDQDRSEFDEMIDDE